ncbi:MAG TPA: tRNA (adenosine(37)-N6)-threonylcarbamoyltransferase complex dimerization subunit type 1 TsaB, partial [Silvibacterium sp.]|nr:tRNA (adenosine(37)-N6)-threonylcarbamoyltransferase complex dimerization subunit type 1 TsaB [Silvibacterium sp.]
WSDGAVSLSAQAELAGKTYAAQLVPKIQDLLATQGSSLEDLKAIIVVNGPGSFTGVRIGVSSAKALAEALSLPLLAVSRLAVLAQKARADMAALDAGRGEFYFREQTQEALFTPEEIRKRLNGTLAVCEENAAHAFPAAMLVDPPTAADALVYAVPRLLGKDFDNIVTLDGNYVRRSDAELFAKPGARTHQTASVKA